MAPPALKESGEYQKSGNLKEERRVARGRGEEGCTEFKARERAVSLGHTGKRGAAACKGGEAPSDVRSPLRAECSGAAGPRRPWGGAVLWEPGLTPACGMSLEAAQALDSLAGREEGMFAPAEG